MRTTVKLTEEIDLEFSVRYKDKDKVINILVDNEMKYADNPRAMSPLKLHDFTVYKSCIRKACNLKILIKTAKIEIF